MNEVTTSIAVIGLGYVGLPLASLFLTKGHTVYGIDLDRTKIEKLKSYQSYLSDFSAKDIRKLFDGGRFYVSDSFSEISHAEAIIICVPTPLDQDLKPDLSYVKGAMNHIQPYLREGHLIVLESSTYPGTTEEELQPMIESTGLIVGTNAYLAYSPERIDPGSHHYSLQSIPKVLGGVSAECTARAKQVYESIFDTVVVVSSPRVAEFTKLLENCQRLVNISFMNELSIICEKMNINLWEAIDAASTKPYGFTSYYPGPGIGGHCIPVDPLYLQWKAKQYGGDLQLIHIAHEINESMPDYIVHRVSNLLSSRKSLESSSLLVLGVSYKKDVNDLRESSSLPIIKKLLAKGIHIQFHDPYIQEITLDGVTLESMPLTKRNIQRHDGVLILTDHSSISYKSLAALTELIIDTRNATKGILDRSNIVLI